MVKIACFFKRRPDITPEAFKKYYEENHSRLVRKYLNVPGVDRYVRRYLTPMRDPISGNSPDSGFDVIMEICFQDQDTFDMFYTKPLDPDVIREFVEDEERFLDRSQLFFHVVDEHDTEFDHKV